MELSNFPDHNKRTAGYQLKYRRNYMERKSVSPPKKQVEAGKEEKIEEELEHDPLTGWS